ncbi:MAG TPA: nucleotide excision repair endonuclease, partial [Candidatus Polarisedimenticolia bacterium]|nr:nucleotide excision repair endonuclease [Candidatus Polarisedimenticolia bacterium]
MKPPLQNAIVSYLRSAGRPQSSRDLASRFLKIERADEEVCRSLLAPILAGVPGVVHRAGEGWDLVMGRPAAAAPQAPAGPAPDAPAPPTARSSASGPLRDFVALATDGIGPGGSGAVRVVSLLPVVAGEACQQEEFPSAPLDEDGLGGWGEAADQPAGEGARAALRVIDLETILETIGDLPVVCHRVAREVEPLRRACAEAGLIFTSPVISAAKLGHLLLGLKASHAAHDLATTLRLEARGPDDCRGRVRMVAGAFLQMIPLLEERGIDSFETLLEYQNMPAPSLDLSRYAFTAEDLKAIPSSPGVYRFLDRQGDVIYVGKSKNLRSRVSSYFVPSARGTPKGQAILDQVHAFAIETVDSDLEAVLLEAALIGEHHPRLNRQFEVHERPAPYGPRLNLAIVLRDALPAKGARASCTVHFVKGGRYLGRVSGASVSGGPVGAKGGGPRQQAAARLATVFFPGSGRAPRRAARHGHGREGSPAEAIDLDWQLVASFLRQHRDE